MKFTTPRGTKDILPKEIALWNQVERVCREIFRIFGYQEIRTPVFEETALFVRSLGNTSDIVQKQILNVAMDKEKGYCRRPEATAAIVRGFLRALGPALRYISGEPVEENHSLLERLFG